MCPEGRVPEGAKSCGLRPISAMTAAQPISGHVFRYEGKRRPTWRAKYRLPDGRQVQKTIGPAWTARGRPPAGYWTKRTAEAWLRRLLVEAAAGTLPGMVRTGATVADACAEYLRYVDQDRQRKPSTHPRLRLDLPQPRPAAPRRDPARGPHGRASRALGGHGDRPGPPDGQPHAREDDHRLPRLHGASPKAPPPPVQPGRRRREAAHRHANRDRGLLPGGGHGARARRRVRAGRRDLPHRRVHRPAPGRARRAALARRRLPRLGDPRPSQLHQRPPDLAEVRQGPLGPDGGQGRRGARDGSASASTSPTRTTSSSPASSAATSTAPRSPSATEPRSSEPRSGRSASTTSATPSARGSSASPTSAASRSGWATRTSRRRCSTSTTSRARRTPRSSAAPSSPRPAPDFDTSGQGRLL